MEHTVATATGGSQALHILDGGRRQIGLLDYQVCHPCRLGYIDCITVAGGWQGQGLAREAVHTALASCPGYIWSTSRQSSQGRAFFSALREESDIAFPAIAERCPHMVLACPLAGPVRGFFAWPGASVLKAVFDGPRG
ncbi:MULTISPECIES: N-acetyltransferase [unclassified Streptomyces]|uniref:N-acetyltransferase n=1 Tax=unclassified Streptomyces TaxID=2593676 RepID=UPI00365522DB